MAIVNILDANDIPQQVSWEGQDTITDYSGVLGAGAVGGGAVFQQVAPANAPNPAEQLLGRAGFLFQNTSQHAMFINEVNALVASSWVVNSGEYWPPPGFTIPTGAIQVIGGPDSQVGDTFAAREWNNAAWD